MPAPRTSNIAVRRHPFASPEGRGLISLLDADLAASYPDWDDLAHPGMHHENNPRPSSELLPTEPTLSNPSPVIVQPKLEDEEKSFGLVFFVAFRQNPDDDAEEAIGCGALRLLPGPGKALPAELGPELKYAEVKRMYVLPSARGLGVSKLILVELEKYAREALELDYIVLETGLRQEPAVKLYEGVGYQRRGMFGEYVGADVESGGDSICLEKRLKETGTLKRHLIA